MLGVEGHVISAEEREELKGKVTSPVFVGCEVGTMGGLVVGIGEGLGESDGLFVEVMSVAENEEVWIFFFFFFFFFFFHVC